MIKRRQLENIWAGLLMLFFIMSIAYSNYSREGYLSPGGVFNETVGKTFFIVFIAGMLLILVFTTILLYLIHKDLDE